MARGRRKRRRSYRDQASPEPNFERGKKSDADADNDDDDDRNHDSEDDDDNGVVLYDDDSNTNNGDDDGNNHNNDDDGDEVDGDNDGDGNRDDSNDDAEDDEDEAVKRAPLTASTEPPHLSSESFAFLRVAYPPTLTHPPMHARAQRNLYHTYSFVTFRFAHHVYAVYSASFVLILRSETRVNQIKWSESVQSSQAASSAASSESGDVDPCFLLDDGDDDVVHPASPGKRGQASEHSKVRGFV